MAPTQDVLAPADPFPGRTYGNLDAKSCLRALDEREVPYERFGHARGVSTPVLLMGPLHGVLFFHADAPTFVRSPLAQVVNQVSRTWKTWLAVTFVLLVLATGLGALAEARGSSWAPAHDRPLSGPTTGQ